MIDAVLYGAVVFLVINVLVSLVRVVRGPADHDRLLALLLMGTTATAVLAVLAHVMVVAALRDAALALVALAALVVLARVRTLRARR
ncbi:MULTISPECIES: hypothetical protein [unclassified Pseudactinotalea]|uniref:hypothetical protein n=1 Tax=unclassified Pseudactinotalea TaxID=2649176 RepID=UPI003C7E121C